MLSKKFIAWDFDKILLSFFVNFECVSIYYDSVFNRNKLSRCSGARICLLQKYIPEKPSRIIRDSCVWNVGS